jgi:quinol monooxygenase YgiN
MLLFHTRTDDDFFFFLESWKDDNGWFISLSGPVFVRVVAPSAKPLESLGKVKYQ